MSSTSFEPKGLCSGRRFWYLTDKFSSKAHSFNHLKQYGYYMYSLQERE